MEDQGEDPLERANLLERIVALMLRETWGIDQPHVFQVDAICKLVRRIPVEHLLVVQKTGFGKSIIVLGAATMRRGVTLCVVPLLGIGTDQVQKVKAMCKTKSIKALHLDEVRGSDIEKVGQAFASLDETSMQDCSLICFCSPQSLQPNTKWHSLFFGEGGLASKQLIKLVAFDEADCIPSDGRFFRPEFAQLRNNVINTLERFQPGVAPILAMTATLTLDSKRNLERLLGFNFRHVSWGQMDRRIVDLQIEVVGQPSCRFHSLMKPYIGPDSDGSRFMIYSHHQTRCDGGLIDIINKILENDCHESGACARAFTGTTGLIEKSFLVELFAGNSTCEQCLLRGVVATKSAIRGISSKDLRLQIVEGFLMNMDDLVQLLGRNGRGGQRLTGPLDKTVFLINVHHLGKLIEQIVTDQANNTEERKIQLASLLQVLRFLVLPVQCYHVAMETLYESPDNRNHLGSCGDNCSYCRNEHTSFTGPIQRDKLIAHLRTIFHKGSVLLKELYKKLNSKRVKSDVWEASNSSIKAGQVHALVLQLLAANIVTLEHKEECKVNFAFVDAGTSGMYQYETASVWEGFNLF